jgi:Spy/CpxP family protein refolding chaperone
MKTLQLAIALTSLLLLGLLPPAAQAAGPDDNIYNYLQLFRSDLNSAKVEIVNRIMKLSPEDAQKFWPIYRTYENELGKLAVDRTELVAEFIQSHKAGTFDNVKAKDVARRWFKSQRARLKLLEKFHGKIEKALSPVQAGQFLQIENQIAIFVDMTIASEMPLVGQSKP